MKQIEILVCEKSTGVVKHCIHETLDFCMADSDQRFAAFARGFKRLFSVDNCDDIVIQLACRNYNAPTTTHLFSTNFHKSKCERNVC